MFIIEDERHAEPQGEFDTLDAAIAELKRRAAIAWDEKPNRAPCKNWRECGRSYEVVEYQTDHQPWKEIGRRLTLELSAAGITWHHVA